MYDADWLVGWQCSGESVSHESVSHESVSGGVLLVRSLLLVPASRWALYN